MRGFLSSSEKPIKHHTLVAKLLEAIFLKAQLAIVKCPAHSFGTDPVTRGNNVATEAAFSSVSMVCLLTSLQLTDQINLPSINDFADMQCRIDAREIDFGCVKVAQDFGHPVCPCSLFHVLSCVAHGTTHVGKGGINDITQSQWFVLGIMQISNSLVNTCMICQQTRQ